MRYLPEWAVLDEFRRLGVERVAPCHCTGGSAIEMFATEYGEGFIRAGVGLVISVGGTASNRPVAAGLGNDKERR